MRQVIKPDVLQRIKDDETLIFMIANNLDKRFRTVYQWVLDNSSQLQAPAVLMIIKKRFSMSDAEILETEQTAA
jgi:hypothetical protein